MIYASLLSCRLLNLVDDRLDDYTNHQLKNTLVPDDCFSKKDSCHKNPLEIPVLTFV